MWQAQSLLWFALSVSCHTMRSNIWNTLIIFDSGLQSKPRCIKPIPHNAEIFEHQTVTAYQYHSGFSIVWPCKRYSESCFKTSDMLKKLSLCRRCYYRWWCVWGRNQSRSMAKLAVGVWNGLVILLVRLLTWIVHCNFIALVAVLMWKAFPISDYACFRQLHPELQSEMDPLHASTQLLTNDIEQGNKDEETSNWDCNSK
jgi:hypothetical protein